MIRRVSVSIDILTLLMKSSSLSVPVNIAHINEKDVAFMELEDNEFIDFSCALLSVAPAFIRSVVGITLDNGTVVVSWYYSLE